MSERTGKTDQEASAEAIDRVHTAAALSISPELFEQLYLAPKTAVRGELRQTFGNPTPIALGGFLLCTTPLSMILLEWQGAGGIAGAANVGSYFFLGGLLLVLGGIGEWIIGNTFPSTVFCTFGGFWLTMGATICPGYGAYAIYSPSGSPSEGLTEPQFFATFSFFLIGMTILCAVYTIASIRTNIVLFSILLLLVPCFACLSASFFAVSHGQTGPAIVFQHAGAALLLVVSLLGWYIFFALILLSVEFPFNLPLGDLSTLVSGMKKRTTEKEHV
ncbi:unnamed protein product [Clonostachys rhizophaga]|uniref:Protein alcS n=1 Tax=Clonostachys rhizophaga TaxID=160324 RepID=A0A9N9VI20_9HYPO|nr:unnamed protein product [Clonostachys rhizophaga]